MKKNTLWLLGIVFLIGSYTMFWYFYHNIDTGEAPIISYDQDNIEISVENDLSALVEGMNVYDKEDGDLSGEIFVESISPFDMNQNRIVKYAVFDSNQHVTKTTRKIHYTDYTKPSFSLKEELISDEMPSASVYSLIGATSCVDGDISNNVVVKIQSFPDTNDTLVKATVKDSTGTTETLDLIYNYDRNNYTTDIALKNYLVYINVGENFNADANIESIKSNTEKENPKQYLEIDNQVNNKVPGVYEVIYSFNKQSDIGLTKCVVVVEENETEEGTKE